MSIEEINEIANAARLATADTFSQKEKEKVLELDDFRYFVDEIE